ncbi:hypothetical protein LFL97_32960 [Burkholderia sp. JSH-S8]|nr:hypothetical protein LFL97_32960 [Burkholderia sp. JSH-S8]
MVDQAGVVRRPVSDAVARLRLVRLAPAPTHLLGKNRESTRQADLLTGVTPRLLHVNVRQPNARPDLCNNASFITSSLIPIRATTPNSGAKISQQRRRIAKRQMHNTMPLIIMCIIDKSKISGYSAQVFLPKDIAIQLLVYDFTSR